MVLKFTQKISNFLEHCKLFLNIFYILVFTKHNQNDTWETHVVPQNFWDLLSSTLKDYQKEVCGITHILYPWAMLPLLIWTTIKAHRIFLNDNFYRFVNYFSQFTQFFLDFLEFSSVFILYVFYHLQSIVQRIRKKCVPHTFLRPTELHLKGLLKKVCNTAHILCSWALANIINYKIS